MRYLNPEDHIAVLLAALEQIERLGRDGATSLPNGSPMQFALADIASKAIARYLTESHNGSS
jgi:hypothetical protein